MQRYLNRLYYKVTKCRIFHVHVTVNAPTVHRIQTARILGILSVLVCYGTRLSSNVFGYLWNENNKKAFVNTWQVTCSAMQDLFLTTRSRITYPRFLPRLRIIWRCAHPPDRYVEQAVSLDA